MNKHDCSLSSLVKKAANTLTRSDKKRLAIVDAARETFLGNGFETTSMDEIAAIAGVSKRTVYSHFGSKEDLFADVMTMLCVCSSEASLSSLDPEQPIESTLQDLGCGFLQSIFTPESMALFRILITQTEKFPDVGKEFYARGPEVMISMLTEYLEAQQAAGIILIDDTREAAGSFMASLYGPHHMRCLVTGAPSPDESEIEKMVTGAVSRFLNGVRVSS